MQITYPAFSLQRLVIGGALACLLLVGISACTGGDTPEALPEGPQTMTGSLQPVPLSIVRRGTHLLLQNGEEVYYVESSTLDLRDYEEMEVVVTGHLEYNTETDDLPVLVASGATVLEETLIKHDVADLKLSLEVPDEWIPHPFEGGIRFTQTGSTEVILNIGPSERTTLPSGSSQIIQNRRAVRTTGSGSQMLHVQNGTQIIVLEYWTPSQDTKSLRLFNRILRTLRFTGSSSAAGTGAVQTGTGSTGEGIPCGGPAGVLCPSGQYCEVTDPVEGIGRCRSLKR